MIKLKVVWLNMENQASNAEVDFFVELLIKWHKLNNRNFLFWRNTMNPYHILVSELMLQKTTAKQVQGLATKFFSEFPTLFDLENAKLKDLKKLITPLGMENRRSVILKSLAKTLIEEYGCKVPSSEKELLKLKGVGRYITNSVLYLAYEKDAPIVDTNIIRILERVFSLESKKSRPRTDVIFWDFVKKMTPSGKSRLLNLALLDFGAMICTAKKPKHEICPVRQLCNYYKN